MEANDAADYVTLAENLRARGQVAKMRNHRGKSKEELLELCELVSALDSEKITLLVYALSVSE